MKRAFAFWIPFGDLMHEEQAPGGAVWARGCGNPKWWFVRAEIFREFTMKSLLNLDLPEEQSIVVMGIPTEAEEFAAPVYEAIDDFNFMGGRMQAIASVAPATATLGRGQSPTAQAIMEVFHLSSADAVTFIHLDSDDMYANDALAEIAKKPAVPGVTMAFRKGFLWDNGEERLYDYDPKLCPPPFFARTYSRSWHANLQQAEEEAGYLSFHHELLKKAKVLIDLPDGKFCVVVHGGNTSSTMRNPAIQSKLMNEIKEDHTKRAILSRFGYSWQQKGQPNA